MPVVAALLVLAPLAAAEDAGTVAGRVRISGAPGTGAEVRLTRLDPSLGALSYSKVRATVARADGSFRFEELVYGSYLLDARGGEQWLPFPIRLKVDEDHPGIEGVVLTLETAAAIEGLVLDEDGAPLAGVQVCVGDGGLQAAALEPVAVLDLATSELIRLGRGFTYPRLPLAVSITDQQGRFRLAPILPDLETTIRVGGLASHHDQTIHGIRAEAGSAAYINVTLTRGATIVGRALGGDGRPARGARITLRVLEGRPMKAAWTVLPQGSLAGGRNSTIYTVGNDGRFQLERLQPGRYLLVAEADEWALTSSPVVVVTRPREVFRIDVVLGERRPIHGTVVAPDGGPIRGAVVEVVTDNSLPGGLRQFLDPVRVPVDEAGRFRIDHLGATVVDLRVECQGRPPTLVEAVPAGPEPVTIELKSCALPAALRECAGPAGTGTAAPLPGNAAEAGRHGSPGPRRR